MNLFRPFVRSGASSVPTRRNGMFRSLPNGKPVMFSPENRRFSLIAMGIVSIVIVVVVAMVVLFGLDLFEGEKKISQSTLVAVGAVTAFAGIAINQMFIILRYEQGHREGQKEREYIANQVHSAKADIEETKQKAEENRVEIVSLKEETVTIKKSEFQAAIMEAAKEICKEMEKGKSP